MEKFMQRGNVVMGYSNQGFSGNSPRTPPKSSDSDMDFNDVFGGPPRRFSMPEVKVRYSFGETAEESEDERASSPWESLKEKPVFGEESVARRRHQGDDFFDDIFKGDDSYSSPRRTDRDRDRSNPASRTMSPARPLPPKSEPFATSLHAQFSLPAKLTKGVEIPTFGSRNHGQNKMDGNANGLNSPQSSSSLSRFSNEGNRGQDEIRSEVHPVYRQSPLSRQASFRREDSPSSVAYDQKDDTENMKKETRNVDSSGNQFHFSIYKWAGKGVPMLMPLVIGNNLKSKDKGKHDRSVSYSGRIESKSSTVTNQGSTAKDLRSKEETKELKSYIEEVVHETSESKSRSSTSDTVVLGRSRQSINDEPVKSLDETDTREKTKKKVPRKIEESLPSEVIKPLHALIREEVERPGKTSEKKEKKNRTQTNAHGSKNVKKNETVDKSSLQEAAESSGATPAKRGVKGKVREFVQIFNQEADSRPKADAQRSQSYRWKAAAVDQNEKEVSSDATKAKEMFINLHNVDKKPDAFVKVDENLNKDEARQYSPTKAPSYTSYHSSTNQKNTFSSESFNRKSKIFVENLDDPLDNFLVQELSDDHEKVAQSEGAEDTKAIDAKIQQWAVGKKGNIRSLLSTLQYVLWPESGWKPVPLVDLIEANSVKRAYQKALLRIHPDKLQQKSAAFNQKYTAEKVFDILQDAWDIFNTLTPL
ncbi:J domain-containing protein required for chloroplast accumulation response 1 [Sesamum alatum]|uniref:J domain-containing protein required for chloroplast accumulation response 1 n=1 Tax=Sesamum alatum TaxID=300844 RepID=A0AAE1YF45_9LAMI|nr:J domain-containing protein required for chloroplast accumulation response 1 [Sesamum alatum]